MERLLHVSSSPHVRDTVTTKNIMYDVLIAMIPAAAFGVYQFGFNALLVIILTMAACVLSEYIFEKAMKRPITIADGSALVTGMILALNMPPEIPIWIPVLGGIFAIIVVKQLYGGLGQNFMNPALAARCFLLISFAKKMTDFSVESMPWATVTPDGVSGATPLALIKAGGEVDLTALLVGNIPGTIGEVSVIALLIGAAYLLWRKVITLRIPLSYILTVLVFTALFGGRGFDVYYLLCEICAGGLIFGAFFMATDYVTGPLTPNGQIVYSTINAYWETPPIYCQSFHVNKFFERMGALLSSQMAVDGAPLNTDVRISARFDNDKWRVIKDYGGELSVFRYENISYARFTYSDRPESYAVYKRLLHKRGRSIKLRFENDNFDQPFTLRSFLIEYTIM